MQVRTDGNFSLPVVVCVCMAFCPFMCDLNNDEEAIYPVCTPSVPPVSAGFGPCDSAKDKR